MKIIGAVLIGVGLALFLFVLYAFLKEKNRLISPLPENKGVKVIFITPTK